MNYYNSQDPDLGDTAKECYVCGSHAIALEDVLAALMDGENLLCCDCRELQNEEVWDEIAEAK